MSCCNGVHGSSTTPASADPAQAEGDLHLDFFFDAPPDVAAVLTATLSSTFRVTVADLALDAHPVLKALKRRYQGVIVMSTSPFEALMLTILSQNRTGEIVRQVYPQLAAACAGTTPQRVAALPVEQVATLIRPAGPRSKGCTTGRTPKTRTGICAHRTDTCSW